MSIAEKSIQFKRIEEKVYREVCEEGCSVLREMLEKMDEEIGKERDKKQYRNKGKLKTTLKTIMGEVEFRRNIYEEIRDGGIKKYVYLLETVTPVYSAIHLIVLSLGSVF